MKTAKKIFLAHEEATKQLGRDFAQQLTPNTVLLLQGNLGAGKTTFIQGLGEGLGINEPIVSPTFTLINEYLEGKIPLYHIDLYRLNPDQVKHLHLENYWDGIEVEAGVTAIEWSDLLPQLPPHYWQITLELHEQSGRNARLVWV